LSLKLDGTESEDAQVKILDTGFGQKELCLTLTLSTTNCKGERNNYDFKLINARMRMTQT
jgi:hypothetical protein